MVRVGLLARYALSAPHPLDRVIVRAVARPVQHPQPGVLAQPAADDLGAVDDHVVADHRPHGAVGRAASSCSQKAVKVALGDASLRRPCRVGVLWKASATREATSFTLVRALTWCGAGVRSVTCRAPWTGSIGTRSSCGVLIDR
jgi:hypothetical protein